ncbi:MAG: hypothetical protein ACK6CT_15910 [Planctomycetia bacterium]|jgi:hypothetical protein
MREPFLEVIGPPPGGGWNVSSPRWIASAVPMTPPAVGNRNPGKMGKAGTTVAKITVETIIAMPMIEWLMRTTTPPPL